MVSIETKDVAKKATSIEFVKSDNPEGEEITSITLEGMFNDNWRFVAAAASTDETRYFMTRVLVEPGQIVATNGRSLHRAAFPLNLKPGFWDTVKSTVSKTTIVWVGANGSDFGQFPNYERVIPDYTGLPVYELCATPKGKKKADILQAAAITGYRFAKFHDMVINVEYFMPITGTWHYQFIARDKSLHLISTDKALEAVIMPMQADLSEPQTV